MLQICKVYPHVVKVPSWRVVLQVGLLPISPLAESLYHCHLTTI